MNYNLLRGKKSVIFGALNENSIAWKVAECCDEEGADIVLTNAPVALRMGEVHERTMAGYGDMADTKAVLESITRSFGHLYGAVIRSV